MTVAMSSRRVGTLLRDWRQRRRFSQLHLASRAEVSPRHLSFVETGRSRPSRELVLHLADHLDVPLRERNALLLAAGYAPTYHETPLDAPEMQPVRDALDKILSGHDPFPAVVVDRRWNLVSANKPALMLLTDGVAPALLEPPANALRVSLHPDGLAPRIVNFAAWSDHLLTRLDRQVAASADDELRALADELRTYPGVACSVNLMDMRRMLSMMVPFPKDVVRPGEIMPDELVRQLAARVPQPAFLERTANGGGCPLHDVRLPLIVLVLEIPHILAACRGIAPGDPAGAVPGQVFDKLATRGWAHVRVGTHRPPNRPTSLWPRPGHRPRPGSDGGC